MPVNETQNIDAQSKLTAEQVSAAAQNAAKAANNETNQNDGLDKAIKIITTAVNYGEKTGALVARDGLPKHSEYIADGAILAVSIARLVATSGADAAAWAAAGKAVVGIASKIVKTMKELEKRDKEFEMLINTYPVTAWICKNGNFDFEKWYVDCSTGAAKMREVRDVIDAGAFEALLTRTYLMYARTVRTGEFVNHLDNVTFSELEYNADNVNAQISSKATVKKLINLRIIKVDNNGDLLPEYLEKFTGLPIRDKNEKINAKVYMQAYRQAIYYFINKNEGYKQMVSDLNLYYASAVVTGGFYHDIVKKQEMEKVIGIAANAFGTKGKKRQGLTQNLKENNFLTFIIIGAALLVLFYLLFGSNKK